MPVTSLLLTFLVVACSSVFGKTDHPGVRYVSKLQAPIPSQCLRENLSIREGETDAAMGGVRVTEFLVTNNAAAPCTLNGYPRVELLNRKGVVSRRASRETSGGGATTSVMLEPGKDASFNVIHNSGGAGHIGKPCPTYPKVKITLPGTTRPFVLNTDISSCARTGLTVSSLFAPTPE